MSAQLFLAPPNRSCGERFATLFFHEDDLAEAMDRLAADQLACRSFEELLAHRTLFASAPAQRCGC